MPNSFLNVVSDNKTLELPVPASLAISIGDLCYWDSAAKQAKPITSLTTGASEIVDQAQVAANFVGVALDARLSGETDANALRLFLADGICDFAIASGTYNLADLVGATWAGGAALVTQQLAKVLHEVQAIGRIVKQHGASTTKVRCRLQSRIAWDLFTSSRSPVGYGNGTTATVLADSAITLTLDSDSILSMVPTAARNVTLPLEARAGAVGKAFVFTNNSGGANTVTFLASGGGGIKGNGACPQNKTIYLWCDGTNWNGLVSA
ncbi:MAG: hypothetical protein K2R98_08580 [Gemmataceae bacterium]|nr:hypothetical protein [Gemmataceae bacterium]